jgi:nickel/cobalt transporter (NicO) family protein
VTRKAKARLTRGVVLLAVVAAAVFCQDAFAQTSPLAAMRQPAPSGWAGWLLAQQALFYRELSGLIRAAKTDGSALWGLMGVSFLYGIFHAAGPGHGKAVISSYLVANEETWRRGVTLSFASALLQAVTAVLIVGVAAVLIGATAKAMGDTVHVIETVSYALIVLVGVRLLWVKGRAFLRALRAARSEPAPAIVPEHDHGVEQAHHAHAVGCDHDHAHHEHAHHEHAHSHAAAHSHDDHAHNHGHAHGHDHPHDHAHDHDDENVLPWGHAHGPEPDELAGPGGWRRGLTAIVAVGLRPCSGAIIVLVFALAQGLFWAGVASTFVMGIGTAITVAAIATLAVGARAVAKRFAATRAGYGTVALRGVEVGAAVVVIAFGALLLTGTIASERMGMF